MALTLPHIDHLSTWLTFVNAASIAVVLLVLYGSIAVEAIRHHKRPKSWRKLYIFQLVTSAAIITLSIVHCALLAKYVATAERTNPVLVGALFWTLSWVILLLSLIDYEHDAGQPHYRAWAVAGLSETCTLALAGTRLAKVTSSTSTIDLAIQAVRLLSILVLLAGTLLAKRRDLFDYYRATDDETRPLLGPEADGAKDAENNKADNGDSKNNSEEEDKGDGDEDDEDEDDEEKKALKEMKKRPMREYISAFAVFLPHLRPKSAAQWVCFTIIGICLSLERLLNVLIPLTLGALINSLSHAQSIPWPQVLPYLLLSVISSAGIITLVRGLAYTRATTMIKSSLIHFCYNHVMSLSCAFHDQKNSSRVARVMDRSDVVVDLCQGIVIELLPQMSDLVISLAVLSWLFGGYISFIVAVTIVLFTWANTQFVKKKNAFRRQWVEKMIAQWQQIWESFYNWATISHFNQVGHEANQFSEKTGSLYNQDIVMANFDAVAQFTRQVVMMSGFTAVALTAISQIVYQGKGVGDFVMLTTYWSRVMNPVSGLIHLVNDVARRLVEVERLLLYLEEKPTVVEAADSKPIEFKGGSIEFDDVSFSYDGERMVTKDVSFHVKAGQTIAIVGETGGGKSTLLKLLFRFYDPTKGRVLIDDQDVRGLSLESFRELVGFVPQDPAMFQRTVFENVRYPDQTASEEDIIEACKGAVLHDKIMTFTKGYKQKVGERGTKLSGGEMQRLAIARCILKKPKILLLDEATSSVDSVTETKIHECLKELCRGRTTFIIAHRLSTILHADQIFVMKNGTLVEAGPHRKLIKKNGPYRELWDAQLKLQSQDPDAIDSKTPIPQSPVLIKDTNDKALEEAIRTPATSSTVVDSSSSSVNTAASTTDGEANNPHEEISRQSTSGETTDTTNMTETNRNDHE